MQISSFLKYYMQGLYMWLSIAGRYCWTKYQRCTNCLGRLLWQYSSSTV